MHQLVILTALTATSGLFGRGACHTGGCARPAMGCHAAYAYRPMYVVSGHYRGYAAGCGTCPTYAAPAHAPAAAPAHAPAAAAPAPDAAPAPATAPPAPPAPQTYQAAPAPARVAYYYPSYYGYPVTQSCPGGNCARR